MTIMYTVLALVTFVAILTTAWTIGFYYRSQREFEELQQSCKNLKRRVNRAEEENERLRDKVREQEFAKTWRSLDPAPRDTGFDLSVEIEKYRTEIHCRSYRPTSVNIDAATWADTWSDSCESISEKNSLRNSTESADSSLEELKEILSADYAETDAENLDELS